MAIIILWICCIALNFQGKNFCDFCDSKWNRKKIFHKYLVTRGKDEEMFTTLRKFLSRNIYFGTEFKKSRKFFATKVWSYTVG